MTIEQHAEAADRARRQHGVSDLGAGAVWTVGTEQGFDHRRR